MNDVSNIATVAQEARRLLQEEPHSKIVQEANARAAALTQQPPYPGYVASPLTELCFLLWQRAGMPSRPSATVETDFIFSAEELGVQVGVNDARIRQLAPELEAIGLARKFGNLWKFTIDAAEWITSRPDERGRPSK